MPPIACLKSSLGQAYGRGRFVAFCGGRVVRDADTFNEVRSRLAEMGKDPTQALIVQAGTAYPEKAVIFCTIAPP